MSSDPSRGAVLKALADYPARLADAARDAATRPTPDGEWTPEQVVRHLIAVETDVHQARLRDLATVPEPRWQWAEPGPWPGDPELGLGGVIGRFAALRTATVATIHELDAAGWQRAGVHATFGTLDVAGLLRNAVDHDEEHLRGLGG